MPVTAKRDKQSGYRNRPLLSFSGRKPKRDESRETNNKRQGKRLSGDDDISRCRMWRGPSVMGL